MKPTHGKEGNKKEYKVEHANIERSKKICNNTYAPFVEFWKQAKTKYSKKCQGTVDKDKC